MALTATIKIKIRTGTLLQWNTANPVLLNGEHGYVSDGAYFVIGDGSTAFNSLNNTNKYYAISQILLNYFTPLADSVADALADTNAAIAQVASDLVTESNARVLGDFNLNTSISNLSSSLTTETNTRVSADQNLQDQIDTISNTINNGLIQILATNAFLTVPIPGLSASEVETALNEIMTIISGLSGGGVGDMLKADYDSNDDGVVNDSDKLGGVAASLYALKNYVDTAIANLVNSSPAALDTLNELATALGNDANFSSTVTTAIGLRLLKSANLSDLADAVTARGNLGLGNSATKNVGSTSADVAPGDHAHNSIEIAYPDAYGLGAAELETAVDLLVQQNQTFLTQPQVEALISFRV